MTSERSAFRGSDMPAKSLPAQTIRNIITVRSLSHLSYRELSALIGVSRTSVGTYLRAFERSSLTLGMMRRLSDEALLRLLLPTSAPKQSYRQNTLLRLFPRIHQNFSDPTTSLLDQWQSYKQQHPQGLGYSRFTQLYGEWLSNNGLKKWPSIRWALPIAHDDYKMLRAWRSSNDKRKWQRAVALLDLHRHCTMASICRKLERSPKTIKRWRSLFLTHGLAGLALPSQKAVSQGLITRSTSSSDEALDLCRHRHVSQTAGKARYWPYFQAFTRTLATLQPRASTNGNPTNGNIRKDFVIPASVSSTTDGFRPVA
jgi:hypothetical protein